MSKEILQNIINDFNANKFTRFFREKSRTFAPRAEVMSYYNDDNFRNGIKLGEIQFAQDDKMLICAFEARQPLSERSGKKAQYEKGKKILKETNADAGIFIFYDKNGSFRFSLIYPEYAGTKRQWSYFKRFTYFVSPQLTNKTFLQQIGEGDFFSLQKIKEAFSVDPVTKQFYNELQSWYFWAMDKIKFPDDYKHSSEPEKDKEIRNSTNLIRLITRVVFIWFLTEKRLVPQDLFSREKLSGIVRDFMKASNFYNAILQNLFFGTLNQKMDERKFAEENGYPSNRKEYGVKNLYRYSDKFLISKNEVLELFKDIPFLNGGLFDCLDKGDESGKEIYVDGFSRNSAKQSSIPDYLFFQQGEERVDLSGYGLGKGRPVRGLIEILSGYNFTIDENTPVDQEIALDPELLGKVFENLLASYNPETSTTARKATGSYYTPREIVDYMVGESLIAYLITYLSSPPSQGGELKGWLSTPSQGGGSTPCLSSPPSQGGEQGVVSKITGGISNKHELKDVRRELRSNLTMSEAALWKLLQNSQLDGRKFRRQHSIGNYVLDFYCPAERLAVELDGEVHKNPTQADYDFIRDKWLEEQGIRIIRFENKIIFENPEGLLQEIRNNFKWQSNEPPRQPKADSPPYKGGELDVRLRQLLSYSDEMPEFSDDERQKIISAIDNIKILDPACGSGAFPMGILHKLVHALQRLDPENRYWHELQYQKALKESEEVFKQGDKNQREERLREINEAFDEGINYPDYARKLYLIENCIYGVDIQPIAIQISKLRFFISLVLDQKVDRSKENLGIRALPNLETKFVAANTLVGLAKPEQLVLGNLDIAKKEEELKKIRHKYFEAKTRTQKLYYQKKDREIRKEIAELFKNAGWDAFTAEKIANFDIYDQNASADWFDPEWMFGITTPQSPPSQGGELKGWLSTPSQGGELKGWLSTPYQGGELKGWLSTPSQGGGSTPCLSSPPSQGGELKGWLPLVGEGGFDVVIGNPPYIRQEDLKPIKPILEKQGYLVYNSTSDIYTYFYEKGWQVLNGNGHLTFITSNKWMRAKYGEKLRKFFKEKTELKQIIDFGGHKVFKSATVDTNILVFQKNIGADLRVCPDLNGVCPDIDGQPQGVAPTGLGEHIGSPLRVLSIQSDFNHNIDLAEYFNQHAIAMKQSALDDKCWTFGDDAVMRLKKKIETIGTPLKDWDVRICFGIKTGFNEAFIIDNETKERLCKEDPKSIEILKPILRGRDIQRYSYNWAGLWLILAKYESHKYIESRYSAIYNHLKQYEMELKNRGQCRYSRNSKSSSKEYPGQHHWLELDNNPKNHYLFLFEKEKIVWQRVTKIAMFCLVDKGIYIHDSMAFLTLNANEKYFIAMLNSKVVNWYFESIAHQYGNTGFLCSNQYVEQLPIPKIPESAQQPFITLVDQILDAKTTPPSAPLLSKIINHPLLPSFSRRGTKGVVASLSRRGIKGVVADTSALEHQIDEMVYKLYGLTEEEIAIVEGKR